MYIIEQIAINKNVMHSDLYILESTVNKQNKRLTRIPLVPVICLVLGICLIAYPVLADWNATKHSSDTISSMSKTVEQLDNGTRDRMLNEARAYNDDLANGKAEIGDERYNTLLSTDSTGIMGSVEIPSINVYEPIYHGSGDDVLMSGAGHVEGTSLPIGGSSTHSVIAGHTGMPGQRMFDEVDTLEPGALMIIDVLGCKLYYKMTSSEVVAPGYSNDLAIVDGEDRVTLVTCTPYGIADKRLLASFERCDAPDQSALDALEKPSIESYINMRTVPLLLTSLIVLSGGTTLIVKKTMCRARRQAKCNQTND